VRPGVTAAESAEMRELRRRNRLLEQENGHRCIRRLWIGQDGSVRLSTRRRESPVSRSAFAGFRFAGEVIMVAVRWYLRYGLSYRDVEELLAERGVIRRAH
jgi:hypothetical protein